MDLYSCECNNQIQVTYLLYCIDMYRYLIQQKDIIFGNLRSFHMKYIIGISNLQGFGNEK